MHLAEKEKRKKIESCALRAATWRESTFDQRVLGTAKLKKLERCD
jgi:hypothetical protein